MLTKPYNILQNLPIRRKLLVMSLLLSGFSISALSVTFLVNEFINYRSYVTNDVKVQASIIAKNIASPLIFQDQHSAREILAGLKSNPRIQAVAVFTAKQKLFVTYLNDYNDLAHLRHEFAVVPSEPADQSALFSSLQQAARHQPLLSTHPIFEEAIVVDNQQVGSVYIQSNLHILYEQLLVLILLVAGIAILTLLIAVFLGTRFQKLITTPIDTLLQAMQQVSDKKDFSHRIPQTSTDELGLLMNGFNQMLSEIEVRDQSLFERQQQLDQLAHYDSLTGLANRAMLLDRLHQALHQARRYRLKMALLFIDLDHFKEINDSLGHKAGDELLKQVAQRLESIVRGSDTVARLGGDEFTICLHNVVSVESACVVAQKVVELYLEPFDLEGHACRVTGSVGVALYPHDALTVEELMKAADTAMYHAKMKGKNTFQLYSVDMQMQVSEKLNLQKNLAKAIDSQEFFLEFQPIIACSTDRIVAVEALLRWNHPDLGILHPKVFLKVAEGTDMVHMIDAWVLRQACSQCVSWHRAGHRELQISVNLSTAQFKQKGLTESVFGILDETGLPPQYLQFDLNESIIQLTCEQALEQPAERLADLPAELPCPYGTHHACALHPLYDFSRAGIRLAFDNFGCGYSSLGYLQHLPIDTIKIAPRFTGCPENTKGADLLNAIIMLTTTLGLECVAEGIETEQQYATLKRLGCQRVQGYLTGRPMSAAAVTARLDSQALHMT